MSRKLIMSRLLFAASIAAFVGAGCHTSQVDEKGNVKQTPSNDKVLRVQGSNTVQPIAQAWKEAFNKTHPDVNITLSADGTGAGFKSLINGTTDICNASRNIKEDELKSAKEKGFEPKSIQIGIDGISIAVNKSNPITKISMTQLRDIYLKKITDWSQVGGTPGQISLISRDSSSGTYEYFKDAVLEKQDFAKGTIFQPSTQAEVQELSINPKAIGYGGRAYFEKDKNLKILALSKTDADTALMPTDDLVRSKKYPLSRPLFIFTRGEPTGLSKDFIDFGLSPEGQKLVNSAGYVSIK